MLFTRAGLCVAAFTTANAVAAVNFSPIALTGTSGVLGPGLGAGVTFTSLDGQQPSINDNGLVVFRANASAGTGSQGLWLYNGTNTNFATAGGTAAGGGTYTAGTSGIFNSAQVNNAGNWAFRQGGSNAAFTNAGVPNRALGAADVAAGTGGATVNSLQSVSPLFNQAGDVGVLADLNVGTGSPAVVISGATANSRGLWKTTNGVTTLVARQNDTYAALDPTGAVRLGQVQNLSLALNDNGNFAFISTLQGTVTTGTGAGSNSVALMSNRSGSMEVLARVGNVAPTASGTDLYRNLGSSAFGFNNAGRVAFVSSLRDAAGVQTSTASLFTDTGSGVMREVARNGAPLPAIAGAIGNEFAGVTWGTVAASPRMNGNGTLAISSSLTNVGTGGSNIILTMSPTDQFTRIARTGDVAIVNGAPLGGDALFNSFSSLTINNIGQLAFSTLLSGPGIAGGPGGNNSAIFAYDPIQGLCLIARTADSFQVAPGDFRTIASIGGIAQGGGQDGRNNSLNDNGQLAFQLQFTDGSSGIFVATIPAVGTIAPLAIAALGLTRRRRA
jgi:hypothetical protein